MKSISPIILALCLFLGAPSFAQTPQWFQLTNSLPGTTRGDDIYFVNQSTDWLARAKDTSFTRMNAQAADAGSYYVVVTNITDNARLANLYKRRRQRQHNQHDRAALDLHE